MNSQSTINRVVTLKPNWKDNDQQGFKEYLEEVYSTNSAISDLFENPGVNVISMTLNLSVTIESIEEVVNEIPLVPVDLSVAEVVDIVSGDVIVPDIEQAISDQPFRDEADKLENTAE